MKSLLLILCLTFLPISTQLAKRKPKNLKARSIAEVTRLAPQATSASAVVTGQTAGPTPFIAQIQLTITPPDSLQSVRFTIAPKPGSVTRPISATYTSEYLQSRGYLDPDTGMATVPVFGLYSDYSNTVTLTSFFTDTSSQQEMVTVTTGPYNDECGLSSPTIIQARTNSTDLSYDYMVVKNLCGSNSPTIIDTDGAIRWVGTSGVTSFASIFFENGFYISAKPPNSSDATGLNRIEFDGTFSFIQDYSGSGITFTGHHNIDRGKYGMLLDVDTTTQTESTIVEVDACGNLLKIWDLSEIISAAMIAGGDDPSGFVHDAPYDWFHNNAATYRQSDDSLIVSSRENFVICLDYETGAIKWILGDPTKHWHDYQSLRNYALVLGPNTLPPIGQHAVSITYDDDLLLFDDGKNSLNQTPPGDNRTYDSVPRKYYIDSQTFTATEVWNYPNENFDSPFCSSVYEDAPSNYLIDYAIPGHILGLDAAGNTIFHYSYSPSGCDPAWNAIPIHLENLFFPGPDPSTDPRGWHVGSVFRQGSKVVIRFPEIGGKTYRLEYKDSLSDVSWQPVSDVTPQCSGILPVTDTPPGGHRFYRVRLLSP